MYEKIQHTQSTDGMIRWSLSELPSTSFSALLCFNGLRRNHFSGPHLTHLDTNKSFKQKVLH